MIRTETNTISFADKSELDDEQTSLFSIFEKPTRTHVWSVSTRPFLHHCVTVERAVCPWVTEAEMEIELALPIEIGDESSKEF